MESSCYSVRLLSPKNRMSNFYIAPSPFTGALVYNYIQKKTYCSEYQAVLLSKVQHPILYEGLKYEPLLTLTWSSFPLVDRIIG